MTRSFVPERLRRTPRAAWFALGTGVVGCLLAVVVVMLPVFGFLGSALALIPVPVPGFGVPWFRIGLTVVAGLALAAGLLVLTVIVRWGWLAWILAVSAVVTVLVVSVAPVVMVAFTAVDTAGEVGPFISEWFERAREATGV